MSTLDRDYWNQRYLEGKTGWDLKCASPPLLDYCSQLQDRSIAILIPGAGNSHEVEELLKLGFQDITVVDIAPEPIKRLRNKFKDQTAVRFICLDFFEHTGQYDLILEQTFFCALDPKLRSKYVLHMAELLKPRGKLVGVLFGVEFEKAGPPFGGSLEEYRHLFQKHFSKLLMEPCQNSIAPRQGNELFLMASL